MHVPRTCTSELHETSTLGQSALYAPDSNSSGMSTTFTAEPAVEGIVYNHCGNFKAANAPLSTCRPASAAAAASAAPGTPRDA